MSEINTVFCVLNYNDVRTAFKILNWSRVVQHYEDLLKTLQECCINISDSDTSKTNKE
jgi:hypothetical protein